MKTLKFASEIYWLLGGSVYLGLKFSHVMSHNMVHKKLFFMRPQRNLREPSDKFLKRTHAILCEKQFIKNVLKP